MLEIDSTQEPDIEGFISSIQSGAIPVEHLGREIPSIIDFYRTRRFTGEDLFEFDSKLLTQRLAEYLRKPFEEAQSGKEPGIKVIDQIVDFFALCVKFEECSHFLKLMETLPIIPMEALLYDNRFLDNVYTGLLVDLEDLSDILDPNKDCGDAMSCYVGMVTSLLYNKAYIASRNPRKEKVVQVFTKYKGYNTLGYKMEGGHLIIDEGEFLIGHYMVAGTIIANSVSNGAGQDMNGGILVTNIGGEFLGHFMHGGQIYFNEALYNIGNYMDGGQIRGNVSKESPDDFGSDVDGGTLIVNYLEENYSDDSAGNNNTPFIIEATGEDGHYNGNVIIVNSKRNGLNQKRVSEPDKIRSLK